MMQSCVDQTDLKKVIVISAHEGSYSWVKTLALIANHVDLSYLTIISDAEYRSSSGARRILNRFFIYLVFPFKVLCSFRRILKQDYIIVITSPFYLPLLVSLVFRRKKILTLHNDLYPEGFSQVAFLQKFKLLFRFYRFVSTKLLQNIFMNVFISKTHFKARCFQNKTVIHTPAVSRELVERTSKVGEAQRCNVGYYGTMGHNHCGIEFLHMLKNSEFSFKAKFKFFVSGSLAKKFNLLSSSYDMSYCANCFLEVSEPLDEHDYHDAMSNTDFGLILLSADGGDAVFPSKFAAHLSYGHPIILVSDQKNDLHRFVVDNAIGVSINLAGDDLDELNGFMKNLSYDVLRNNCLSVFEEYFNYRNIAQAFLREMKVYD